MKRLLMGIVLGAIFVACTSTTALASTVTTPVTADAYITDGSTTNHGSDLLLHTDASPVEVTYLYVDVSGLAGGPVTSATLRMASGSTRSIARDFRKASSSWSEGTLNGTNEPPSNGTTVAS